MEHGFSSLQGQRGLTDDVGVLLHHLSALPEARLDAAFAGISTGGPTAALNRPPAATPTKDAFLKALMEVTGLVAQAGPAWGSAPAGAVAERLSDASAGAPAGKPLGPKPLGPLSPEQIALMIAARDFLATLARPATVESIRITREYGRAIPLRMMGELLERVLRRLTGRRPDEEPDEPAQRRSARFGRGLAVQIRAWQVFTLCLVTLTVLLSIYALTGRGLVQEVGLTDARFTALATDMEAAEKADAPVFMTLSGVGADDHAAAMPRQYVQRYCEAILRTANGERFATRQQQRLCDRYDGYNEAFQQLFQRLRYWHSRVPGRWFPIADACPPGQVLRGDLDGCVAEPRAPAPAARPDGDPTAAQEPTAGNSATLPSATIAGAGTSGVGVAGGVTSGGGARSVGIGGGGIGSVGTGANRPEGATPASGAAQRAWVLQQLQHLRLEVVTAQVILQAITEYLLPCLYAMLGALAAVLGNVARKADDATLSFSDGGVTFRTLVLGVLFGAVIGLFSSQVGPAVQGAGTGTAAASLTPAALSLLAGYSVAQVFQFFDGMSVRVFGPRSPAGTPTG